jgi:hypothetical protein
VGARYNTLKGQLISKNYTDMTVNRYQVGGGWFVTPNVLAKLEYVNQKYLDFPTTDIRYGGQFKGFMISGAVGSSSLTRTNSEGRQRCRPSLR